MAFFSLSTKNHTEPKKLFRMTGVKFSFFKNYYLPIKLLLVLICVLNVVMMEAGTKDSLNKKPGFFRSPVFKAVIFPSAMITYGLSVQSSGGWPWSSNEVNNWFREKYPPDYDTEIDNITRYLPVVAVYGLNLTGVKGKHDFVNRTLIWFIANTVTRVTVYELKKAIPAMRPDGGMEAMPSGHSAEAFVAATFMYEEYKDKNLLLALSGYTMAIATAYFRMANNRHWLADVIVGGGIGILITKLTYLIYPWIQKKVCPNRKQSFAIAPAYYGNKFELRFVMPL